jgi:hypothetical protein
MTVDIRKGELIDYPLGFYRPIYRGPIPRALLKRGGTGGEREKY